MTNETPSRSTYERILGISIWMKVRRYQDLDVPKKKQQQKNKQTNKQTRDKRQTMNKYRKLPMNSSAPEVFWRSSCSTHSTHRVAHSNDDTC